MNERLSHLIKAIQGSEDKISTERKYVLDQLANEILKYISDGVTLQFICTHNSRRSIFSEAWAYAISQFYGLNTISVSSGGTAVTKVYSSVLECLTDDGFALTKIGGTDENPHFLLKTSSEDEGIELYSKLFNEPIAEGSLIAVMTCNDADQNCPVVPGATSRVSLPFVDPKWSDGMKEESDVYTSTSRTILREMSYVFNQIKK